MKQSPMRRNDREIKDFHEIEKFLSQCKTCRLGLIDGDEPYIVPMNFGYAQGKVYLHGAREGKKFKLLEKNPRVCLEWDQQGDMVEDPDEGCRWSMKYRSVIAWGPAKILEGQDKKIEALNVLMKQFSPKETWEYSPTVVKNTVIVEVTLDRISGKEFQ
ncbi:MAG: pyridoxamine 5'-phosphate oxidase family protein [Spirochaetaceae bacterium]|jgi:nitroimidazol reductase NimA-like FMN-containing flavoprotein (pyridoxamine 5'-phosphate oxidase superfamily)|nr:pyridoxamine 5'-phosphate oxidase family protein [Spirochaetaceae bacterium]